MMNEEKRDRMIRESLDRYLSGIDALPSQRAAISKSLVDRPPIFRRAAFRAVAVPAALTLLLCAGIGVFAGLQNHTAFPDHVKTDEALIAAQPEPTDFIALTSPEGEEGGTDTVVIGEDGVTWDQWGAVVPTVEPEPEATVRLAEFISLWREHRWADMLEMCTPDWTGLYEDPEAKLAELASFVTPGAFEIESVTEIRESFLLGYSMYFTVRTDENPDALYRVCLALKKETDSRLYAYPDTLKYYEVLAPQELVEATEAERFDRAVMEDSPELAAALAPVSAACEDAGIRMEIVSAAMSDKDALVVYTLQDLEDSRISSAFSSDFPSLSFDWTNDHASTSRSVYSCLGRIQNKLTNVIHFYFDEPISHVNLSGRAFMNVSNLTSASDVDIDLIQLLKQYGDLAGNLTELPNGTHATGIISDLDYSGEQLREMGIKVLDPSKALDIPLGNNLTLTGIALKEDGMLRLQLRYPEDAGWWVPHIRAASGVPVAEDPSVNDPCGYILWSGTSRNPGCWLEMQIPLSGIIVDGAALIVETKAPDIIRGNWKAEFPVGQVWAGESTADIRELPAAETEETPETGEDAEIAGKIEMYAAEFMKENPELASALVPVNMACEADGFRLEIVSAAMSEQNALVVYTLEDLQETGILSDPDLEFPTLRIRCANIPAASSYPAYCGLDKEKNRITTLMCIRFISPADPAVLPEQLSMYIDGLETTQSREVDLIPLLKLYGSLAGDLTELPERAAASAQTADRAYFGTEFLELGIRVLDPSKALDVPLGENVTLTGIALKEDGVLHLQMRYPKDAGWWLPQFKSAGGITMAEGAFGSDRNSFVFWGGIEGDPACWLEMQLPLDGGIGDNASLIVKYTDTPKIVHGTWQVDIPTEQIRVDTLDLSDTAAAEPVCIPWNHRWTDTAEAETEAAPETPDPAEAPAEAVLRDEPYTNVRLVKFFRLWREQDWQGMLDMCTSGWKAQAEDPLNALEGIARIRTPEIVSMEPLPAVEPEYLMDCTVRSGEDRDGWYRLTVALEKEADGIWYINPESLDAEPLSEEEIAARRPMRTGGSVSYYPTVSGEQNPWEYLRSCYPQLTAGLVPVGLSCESDGICFEIISAAVEEDKSLIVYSLKDLTADRVSGRSVYNAWLHCNDTADFMSMEGSTLTYMDYDEKEHSVTLAMYLPGSRLYKTEGNLKFSLEDNLLFYDRSEDINLMPVLREYEDRTWELADPPEDVTLYPYYSGYDETVGELIRNSGVKVLDSTGFPEIPLAENVTLGGIGYTEDNRLHVQLHVVNNGKLTDSSGYDYRPVFYIAVWGPDVQNMDISPVEWTSGEDRADVRIEYAWRCTRESLNRTGLSATVLTTRGTAHGTWEIEVPADSVRK